MGATGLNLAGLGLASAGGILLWSAVNDPAGGPIAVVGALLKGTTPTPGTKTVTASTGTQSFGSAPSGAGGIVGVAQTYLGTPYSLGGASHSGIDCSGLVLVAYRDGAGITLPHKATAQAARGRAIPRDQVAPGDLVAWGVPGNYPHIAIATDATMCIGAWTWGVPCRYDVIDQKAVPGFGFPDIIRVMG
jgi:cell wall-associated NlpC family hydrolase